MTGDHVNVDIALGKTLLPVVPPRGGDVVGSSMSSRPWFEEDRRWPGCHRSHFDIVGSRVAIMLMTTIAASSWESHDLGSSASYLAHGVVDTAFIGVCYVKPRM